jgi:hypothetical protein
MIFFTLFSSSVFISAAIQLTSTNRSEERVVYWPERIGVKEELRADGLPLSREMSLGILIVAALQGQRLKPERGQQWLNRDSAGN